MQKEYVIQFHKTINKLLCNLSFAGEYMFLRHISQAITNNLCSSEHVFTIIIVLPMGLHHNSTSSKYTIVE